MKFGLRVISQSSEVLSVILSPTPSNPKHKKYVYIGVKLVEQNVPIYSWNRDGREKSFSHYENVWDQLCVCALVEVTKEFDPFSEETPYILYDSMSYQIRPKTLYNSPKGIYYIMGGSRSQASQRVYLSKSEREELDEFVRLNIQY